MRWYAWIGIGVLLAGGLVLKIGLDRRAYRDLQSQLDQVQAQAVAAAKASVGAQQKVLSAQEARLQVALARTQFLVQQLEGRVKALDAELGKVGQERQRLVEVGTVDEVIAKGRLLGYHLRKAERCAR